MKQTLEDFAKEWNPLNDFKYFKFRNTTREKDRAKLYLAFYNNNVKFVISNIKPLTRGLYLGAAIGGISQLVSQDNNQNISDTIASYGIIGSCIDLTQYVTRGMYNYIKVQIFPPKKEDDDIDKS